MTWSSVECVSYFKPPPRASHSMSVVGDAVVIYGGSCKYDAETGSANEFHRDTFHVRFTSESTHACKKIVVSKHNSYEILCFNIADESDAEENPSGDVTKRKADEKGDACDSTDTVTSSKNLKLD